MSTDKGELDRIVDEVKQLRDELEVKIHLGAAEARTEWEQLEKQWNHVQSRLGAIGRQAGATAESVGTAIEEAAEESAESISEAVKLAGAELKKGYTRIRQLLK